MLVQTIASDLLVDLSAEAQQLLAGGRGKCPCSAEKPEEAVSPAETQAPVAPVESYPSRFRAAVGFIITATPVVKCETGECTGFGGGMGGGQ